MKKIISLALALILTLSVLVLPAFAAENNTQWCPECGTTAVITEDLSRELSSFYVSSCDNAEYAHTHYNMMYYDLCECPHCGDIKINVYYGVSCLVG